MPDEPKKGYTQEKAVALVQSSNGIYEAFGTIRSAKPGDARKSLAQQYLDSMVDVYANTIGGVDNRAELQRVLDGTQPFQKTAQLIGALDEDLGPRDLDGLILQIDQAVYGILVHGYASRTPVAGEDKCKPDEKLSEYRIRRIEELARKPPEAKKGP